VTGSPLPPAYPPIRRADRARWAGPLILDATGTRETLVTNTPTQLPSWTEAVRSHLAELTPQTARTCLHLEQVAATVATADAGLVEPASRTRDPFSWAAAATFECADAAACFEEIAD
jgi:hypothetical protein